MLGESAKNRVGYYSYNLVIAATWALKNGRCQASKRKGDDVYEADLTGRGHERQVGYLARGHSFTKGTVSKVVFDCLVALVEQPLSAWCGYHTCDLGWCGLSRGRKQPKFRYKGRVIPLGATDILVPADEVFYRAPSLILHYIRRHRYLPPPCFV